jgi:hypothetical protein
LKDNDRLALPNITWLCIKHVPYLRIRAAFLSFQCFDACLEGTDNLDKWHDVGLRLTALTASKPALASPKPPFVPGPNQVSPANMGSTDRVTGFTEPRATTLKKG